MGILRFYVIDSMTIYLVFFRVKYSFSVEDVMENKVKFLLRGIFFLLREIVCGIDVEIEV